MAQGRMPLGLVPCTKNYEKVKNKNRGRDVGRQHSVSLDARWKADHCAGMKRAEVNGGLCGHRRPPTSSVDPGFYPLRL